MDAARFFLQLRHHRRCRQGIGARLPDLLQAAIDLGPAADALGTHFGGDRRGALRIGGNLLGGGRVLLGAGSNPIGRSTSLLILFLMVSTKNEVSAAPIMM
jgi:hypothetical protein